MDLLVNIDVPDPAIAERVYVEAFGLKPTRSNPFGHGICLIQFLGRGYDEIATLA